MTAQPYGDGGAIVGLVGVGAGQIVQRIGACAAAGLVVAPGDDVIMAGVDRVALRVTGRGADVGPADAAGVSVHAPGGAGGYVLPLARVSQCGQFRNGAPQMQKIQLDFAKLHGFKIVAQGMQAAAAPTIGTKVGDKVNDKVAARLSAKIGQKVGIKAR